MDIDKILKAGQITKQVREYAKTIVKPKISLIELADKIEAKIFELGGKPAFPTTFGINEIAAHCTPGIDSKEKAHGLIKVDFGVHIDGWTADNAFSVDLEDSDSNKKLIKASESALTNAIELAKKKIESKEELNASDLGAVIQETIESQECNPIINLCGHNMGHYELHGGITIPNIDDNRKFVLHDGLYAIEPFTTNGSGKVRDGKPSGIYELRNEKQPRSQTAREVLEFIKKEYETLPFCSRWIVKSLGSKALFGLRELEALGVIHQFDQLVEVSNSPVAQAEHTILIENGKVTVTDL